MKSLFPNRPRADGNARAGDSRLVPAFIALSANAFMLGWCAWMLFVYARDGAPAWRWALNIVELLVAGACAGVCLYIIEVLSRKDVPRATDSRRSPSPDSTRLERGIATNGDAGHRGSPRHFRR